MTVRFVNTLPNNERKSLDLAIAVRSDSQFEAVKMLYKLETVMKISAQTYLFKYCLREQLTLKQHFISQKSLNRPVKLKGPSLNHAHT